jgi:hypothetical protein
MATIIKRIKKGADETVLAFKQRISREYNRLCNDLYPGASPDSERHVLSRLTENPVGVLNVRYAFQWGSAFPDLPDDACCIAWLSRSEARAPLALVRSQS